MLYISELLDKPVVTKGKQKIGKLADLVFVTSEVPYITKIQVQTKKNTHKLYSIQSIKSLNGTVDLIEMDEVSLAENEAFIGANLLDQQIIDIKGKNIVRVNDVVIQEKPDLAISGIDIGWTGILRWFNLERPITAITKRPIHHTLLPWSEIQPLELARGKVVLNKEEHKLKSIQPEDLADYLEKTTIHNAMRILSLVTKETASEVIQNLNINYQTQIFRQMTPEMAAEIVRYADPDEAADLLLTVSLEKKEHILSLVSKEKKKELEFLLSHAETVIGELMTTEFLTFSAEDTAKTVMDRIKYETGEFSNFPYGYVVNKKEELIGVFSLHELLLQSEYNQVLKFMNQNVGVIYLTTPRSIAIRRMLKYKLRAIPVIDAHRQILGIVTFDDVVEPILEKM
jgi:CBS domain-containing protein